MERIKAKVTPKTASKVFAEYSIGKKKRGEYAIDHLVPIDIGGANTLSNLWPIPLKGVGTPGRKFVVDAAVHKSVCAGFVPLTTAQHLFNSAWPSVDTNLVIPAPTTKLDWFFSDGGSSPVARFVVTVTNPGLEPLQAVNVSWNAFDNSNALVGSYSSTIPTINAVSTFQYVGGAGSANLTGVPASATATIAKKGTYVNKLAVAYTVDSVQFAPAPYPFWTGASTYDVSGFVTIGKTEIPSGNLDIVIVLMNAQGQVIGGDFNQPTNLPTTLTPGLRIKIDDGDVPVIGTPTSAAIEAAPTG